MKKYLTIILSSFIVGISVYAFQPATLFIDTWNGIKRQAVYSQAEADKLFKQGYKLEQGQFLGSSITTINGSDTLSNSRTTINNNFASLNNDKIEVSTTTLPNITTLNSLSSVGTITSGTWSADAIVVGKGGTGTTSPSLYQIMLGNGSNGLTTASTTGSNGQFLTSTGSGSAPTWQSATVNTADDYNWTGQHTFNASSTMASTSVSHLYIGNYLGDTLVGNATSTAHYHPSNSGVVSTSTVGMQIITHRLGVIPRRITIRGVGANGVNSYESYGVWDSFGGATSTQASVGLNQDSSGNAQSTQQPGVILYDYNSSAKLWTVSATTFVLYFDTVGTNGSKFIWEAEY